MKILHIVGGSAKGGAFKGVEILHNALLKLDIDSNILNDTPIEKERKFFIKKIFFVNNNFSRQIMTKIFVNFEKFLKSIFLKSPRPAFTIGLTGFDITKLQEYKEADIIHIHWLNQGFINLKSISKIRKPIIWTMRDMWAFTGGSHYTMDFEKYEDSYLSLLLKKYKKKIFEKNIQFIAISNWLKNKAKQSDVLKNYDIKTIYNNININDFELIDQVEAKLSLNISTKKKILLFGAQNPQSKRKGWNLLLETLKKLNKDNFYLLIYGNFWSHKILDKIGIEYKSMGFVNDKKFLNLIYCSSDIFLATSIQEAFGKTWAEAMACNIPVICFDNTSTSEIIDHKINGYIVDGFDSEKLKDGINWMIEEKNNLKNNKIREKIDQFNSSRIAKKYIEIYKRFFTN